MAEGNGTVQGNRMARIKTKIKGLEASQANFAQIIYRKPTLTFELQGQMVVNEGTEDETVETVDLEIDFKVDPKLITPEHNNQIQAIRDQINTAQRVIERAASIHVESGSKQITRADLPNRDLLTEIYADLDEALDRRLIDSVMKDENGRTLWGYVDSNGQHVNLTMELLRSDLRMAEQIHSAWQEWYRPTKKHSEAASRAKTANNTQDSTPPTNNRSSSVLPGESGAAETNGRTITDALMSQPGANS